MDTFAVPATGSIIECDSRISGAIVSKGRNRLDPDTISNIMQYKRWLNRTGVVASYLKELGHIKDMATKSEKDAYSTSSELEEEE